MSLAEVSARIQRIVDGPARSNNWGIVATVEQDTIAFGQLIRWGHKAEISDLIVAPDWRGQGVGTAVVTHLLELAWQQPFELVEIGAARSNPRALALYRKLGFVEHREVILDVGQGLEPIVYLACTDKVKHRE